MKVQKLLVMGALVFAGTARAEPPSQAQAQIQAGGVQVQVQSQAPGANAQQVQQQAVQSFHMEQHLAGQNASPANAQVQSQQQPR